MDAATYDDLHSRLMSLIHEFIDAGEFGVALEWMADALGDADVPISDQDRSDILGLARAMDLDGRVDRALFFCPAGLHDMDVIDFHDQTVVSFGEGCFDSVMGGRPVAWPPTV